MRRRASGRTRWPRISPGAARDVSATGGAGRGRGLITVANEKGLAVSQHLDDVAFRAGFEGTSPWLAVCASGCNLPTNANDTRTRVALARRKILDPA